MALKLAVCQAFLTLLAHKPSTNGNYVHWAA